MAKQWTEGAPPELVTRVLRGLHRQGQVIAVQEVQDAIYAFPDACIQAKDMLWITLEVVMEGKLTIRMEELGEWLCDAGPLIREHLGEVSVLHAHLMVHEYTPVAAGPQTRQ